MRIGIAGAGPAGLYFALLMKARDPAHEILVVEQNPEDATYGWGVVFSDRALSFLADADAASYADIAGCLETWDDQVIVHRGQRVTIDGLGFAGIARLTLLGILQEHCRRRGVELRFGTRLETLAPFGGCDLVVGADGVNSVVRERLTPHLEPGAHMLSNRYVWYGTRQRFEALTLTFRASPHGAFVAHHYRHGADTGTFIVECDAATWHRAGFASMEEADSRRYCEEVFRDDLGGHPLLTNRSVWTSFREGHCRRFHHGNAVLIGDALRTVHFSIGSGTRMALGDAIALARAFEANPDVPAALRRFEENRRPEIERVREVAARSARWYERFAEALRLDPLPFAHDYLMRGGRISPADLRARSPRFAASYDTYLSMSSGRRRRHRA